MAGVYKRKSDRERKGGGKYTVWWKDESGKIRSRVAYSDKAKSKELAEHLDAEARRVREGIVDPGERTRRESGRKPVAVHVEDYRLGLLARGGTPGHARHVAGAVARLLDDAGISSVAEIVPQLIQSALGRLRQRRSPRTCNHALAAVRAFATWLAENNRIKEVPRGLRSIPKFNEAVDRTRERRAATKEEIDRLLAAAESGPPYHAAFGPSRSIHNAVWITGPERAALYRLAMGTGFRAEELRTLTPERFAIDDPEPTVTVLACYSKNGKQAVQPITRELAEAFRPFLAGKEPGRPVLAVPEKTAKMLRFDLTAAGIPYRDANGLYLDFHALRASYITHLIADGANPKVVQKLARHSSITLTMDRYCKPDDRDMRAAIEGKKPDRDR